ncbi:MAG: phosphotransacetylase family protein [Dehalococcoidales bacterium]|nr:MAG: phosphotransacetylase family protein [Dehalococcoidales bacterium]
MVALYVTSSENGSGKTTVSAGLGKQLLNDGKKVSYFKPVIAGGQSPPQEGTDSDVAFIKHLFALAEPVELLNPVLQDNKNLTNKIKEAYNKVSKDKDVVIIEGISDQLKSALDIVRALDAKVIIVEAYSQELLKAEEGFKDLRSNLLGTVVNKVPGNMIEHLPGEISTRVGKNGTTVLGVIPEDRTLLAPTIGELAEYIKGEILSGADKSDDLVESFMIGAMSVDSGLDYLSHRDNKAVVVRSERPDMQLAALETSTKCLVISGFTAPKPVIVARATEKNIPIILTDDDISTVASNIENALVSTKLSQGSKLPRITEIIRQRLNLPAVYQGMGIAA